MPLITDVTSAVLGSSVGEGGSFTIPYPAGRDFYDYDGQTGHVLSAQGAPVLLYDAGQFSMTLGPTSITIVIQINRTLVSGETVYLTLSRGLDSDLALEGRQGLIYYGAETDGVTDDADAVVASIEGQTRAIFPLGVTYINEVIQAESSSGAWGGIEGYGHESMIKLGAGGSIRVQNRVPGGALGVTHWAQRGIENLTIYSDSKAAEFGVVVGTDTTSAQTSIDLTCNGEKFENVGIYNVETAWQVGFSTLNTWVNCHTRDCDYGWFFHTATDSSAADMWTLINPLANSHDVAGLVAYSQSTNALSGTITGGMFNDNAGWGAAFIGQGNDTYTLTGTHFESNGTEVSAVASDVTIREVALTEEPGHLYADGVNLNLNGCAFFGGFIQAKAGAHLRFNGGAIYAGVSGSSHLNPFKNTEAGALLSFGGGLSINNPGIDTDATIFYEGRVKITGTTNDRIYVASRVPATIKAKAKGLIADPSFESGVSGFTASASGPTVAQSATNPLIGSNALRVTYTSTAGALNTNALRWNSGGTLVAGQYVAMACSIYSNKITTLRFGTNTTEYGNNMGTPLLNFPANSWVRVGILWRNRDLLTDATNLVFGIWPEGTDAPVVDFDAFDITKGTFDEVLPTLQGFVGLV